MNDTPLKIKEMQMKVWLSKSKGERIFQFLKDNEELYLFWKQNQKNNK